VSGCTGHRDLCRWWTLSFKRAPLVTPWSGDLSLQGDEHRIYKFRQRTKLIMNLQLFNSSVLVMCARLEQISWYLSCPLEMSARWNCVGAKKWCSSNVGVISSWTWWSKEYWCWWFPKECAYSDLCVCAPVHLLYCSSLLGLGKGIKLYPLAVYPLLSSKTNFEISTCDASSSCKLLRKRELTPPQDDRSEEIANGTIVSNIEQCSLSSGWTAPGNEPSTGFYSWP